MNGLGLGLRLGKLGSKLNDSVEDALLTEDGEYYLTDESGEYYLQYEESEI